MTRSNSSIQQFFDPKIEKTIHKLNKASTSNHINDIDSDCDIIFSHILFDSDFDFFVDNMVATILRELVAPDITYNALCIEYPDADVPFELKFGLVQLLPKFNGLAGDYPHKHLKEFHIVRNTMKLQGVPKEHIKLRSLSFSLQDVAKDWFYYLQLEYVTS